MKRRCRIVIFNEDFVCRINDGQHSVNVAFTFRADTHGTFWFRYDVDASTAFVPDLQPASGDDTTCRNGPAQRRPARDPDRPADRRRATALTEPGGIDGDLRR